MKDHSGATCLSGIWDVCKAAFSGSLNCRGDLNLGAAREGSGAVAWLHEHAGVVTRITLQAMHL